MSSGRGGKRGRSQGACSGRGGHRGGQRGGHNIGGQRGGRNNGDAISPQASRGGSQNGDGGGDGNRDGGYDAPSHGARRGCKPSFAQRIRDEGVGALENRDFCIKVLKSIKGKTPDDCAAFFLESLDKVMPCIVKSLVLDTHTSRSVSFFFHHPKNQGTSTFKRHCTAATAGRTADTPRACGNI